MSTNQNKVQEAIEKSISDAKIDLIKFENSYESKGQTEKEKRASRNYKLKQAIKTIDRSKMTYKLQTQFSLRKQSKQDIVILKLFISRNLYHTKSKNQKIIPGRNEI